MSSFNPLSFTLAYYLLHTYGAFLLVKVCALAECNSGILGAGITSDRAIEAGTKHGTVGQPQVNGLYGKKTKGMTCAIVLCLNKQLHV